MERRFADPPVSRSNIAADNRDAVERTYWNAVAHSDACLGKLVTRLKSLGVWDDTILLVSGDHGEALFEDGFLGHGHIINRRQYATFLVSNRPLPAVRAPLAISDYRGVVHKLLGVQEEKQVFLPPFMHIGELDAPSAIGLAGTRFGVVSLRLDTGTACFEKPVACSDYDSLTGVKRQTADALVARWGSERWALHQRQTPRSR